jgi:NAD(P)-dependent dehydrogenase (short-subunit alcohol dehydrogenase family)
MTKQHISISGKRILLVGATGILGRVYASELAKVENVQLMIADTSQTDVLSYAKQLGVVGVEIDVSSETSVVHCLKYVESQFGGLDSVINNAAATGEGLMNSGEAFADFEEYPLAVWKKTIDINLTGVFLVAREAGRLIKATSKCGAMINISSIYGVVAPDHRIYEGQQFKSFPGYSASKSGVIGITKWLATWWGGKIRVNCISPGGVYNQHNEDFVKAYSNRVPIGRMAEREELVGIVLYLLSDSSSYVTGQNFIIDGGLTTW